MTHSTKIIRRRSCLDKAACGYRFLTVETYLKESTYYGKISNPVLVPEQVAEVRWLSQNKVLTQEKIGKRYGITQKQVSKIHRGLSWPTVQPVKPPWIDSWTDTGLTDG